MNNGVRAIKILQIDNLNELTCALWGSKYNRQITTLFSWHQLPLSHSIRSEVTGLEVIALKACTLIVMKAINKAIPPDIKNTFQSNVVRKAKPASQFFIIQ